MMKLDYRLYAEMVLKVKKTYNNHSLYAQRKEKLIKQLERAFNTVYNTICIDIDKTITETENGEEIIPKKLQKGFQKISNLDCYVCFITGRGKENAKKAILAIIDLINSGKHKFTNYTRWFCITNNGVDLLYSLDNNPNNFLNMSKNLMQDNNFRQEKQKLRAEISKIISEIINETEEKVSNDSINSSGGTSLRFPIDNRYDSKIYDDIYNNIKNNLKQKKQYNLAKGVYEDKIVFEITSHTKGEAIKALSVFLGISEDKMVRIGDQGIESGNDYTMLNCNSGFSVDTISKDFFNCIPVFDWHNNYKILKGTEATGFLLDNLYFYPTITLNKPDRKKYLMEIGMAEKESFINSKKLIENYTNRISKYLKNSIPFNINELIDMTSGAIILKDWECINLYLQNKNHFLFQIFLPNYNYQENIMYLEYAMHMHDGIMLRGPSIYYYGLCNRRGKTINWIESRTWKENMIKFINHSYKVLNKEKNTIKLDRESDRKVLLGIMDNIRNILLITYNTILQSIIGENNYDNQNVILNLEDINDEILQECYKLIKKNSLFFYKNLFTDEIDSIDNYIKFLEEIKIFYNNKCKALLSKIHKSDSNFNFNNSYRVWREIDNFFENVIAVDSFVTKQDWKTFKKIEFYCIRYGSIELPIIADILFNTIYSVQLEYKSKVVSLLGNYKSRHDKAINANFQDVVLLPNEYQNNKDAYKVLVDDNLLTGKTMQIVIELLVKKDIYPDKIIVVRYPTINRIEQMLFKDNSGAPDTTLLYKKIEGLVTPAPYSKICKQDETKYLNFEFKDKLGVFNRSRNNILRYLYLNGSYISGSEVDKIIWKGENNYGK